MASRKPLCIIGGLQKELPSSDSLDANVLSDRNMIRVNVTGHGFVPGDILRRGSGAYAKAKADNDANSKAVGIVQEAIDGGISFDDFTIDAYAAYLVSAWSLEETSSVYKDSKGSNDGSAEGTLTRGVTGKSGLAVTYGGNSGYVKVPEVTTYPSGDFSVSCWFKSTDTREWQGLCSWGTQNPALFIHNGVEFMYLDVGGGHKAVSATNAAIHDGNWHHFGYKRTGGYHQFYLDGSAMSMVTNLSETTAPAGQQFQIGAYYDGGPDDLHGTQDEFYLWSIALSDAAMLALYNSGSGKFYKTVVDGYFYLVLNGIISLLSGLTDGSPYYLSPSSAGALTVTKPSTSGQIVKPVMIATGVTSGIVQIGNGLAIP